MIYNLEIYFMMFIFYAVAGWLMEVTLGLIENHKFVNRGFLIGPYCPIYGVGVVSVSLLLSKVSNNIVLLFILSTLICGTLEYATSYFMEKIFKARWWDYTRKKFNINGRVCLETLIPFGIISVLVICFANPWLLDKLHQIPENILNILVIVLMTIYLIDSLVSFNIILRFKNLTKKEKDNTEEIAKKVKETAEAAIERLMNEKESLIGKVSIRNFTLATSMKYTRRKYTRRIKDTRLTLVGTFKARILEIDDKMKEIAKDLSDKIASIKDNQMNLFKAKEKFVNQSKLNKRLISAFPNVEQREYTRKKKK
ncbi:MAG: putative ABC transporter permease [Clostridia bacterium]|nr:putative ABC transporter permease [Clostridia bacterium]